MQQADRVQIAQRHQQRRHGSEDRLRRLVAEVYRQCAADPDTKPEKIVQMIRRAGEQPTDA